GSALAALSLRGRCALGHLRSHFLVGARKFSALMVAETMVRTAGRNAHSGSYHDAYRRPFDPCRGEFGRLPDTTREIHRASEPSAREYHPRSVDGFASGPAGNTGSRLPRNAANASSTSGPARLTAWARVSAARASSRVRVPLPDSSALVCAEAVGDPAASR